MAYENFPYTNFHDLNLDWILEEVKKAVKLSKETSEGFDDLQTFVLNYFNDLDVSQLVSDKINQMKEDGTLATVINETIFNELSTRVDNIESEIDNITVKNVFNSIEDLKRAGIDNNAIVYIVNLGAFFYTVSTAQADEHTAYFLTGSNNYALLIPKHGASVKIYNIPSVESASVLMSALIYQNGRKLIVDIPLSFGATSGPVRMPSGSDLVINSTITMLEQYGYFTNHDGSTTHSGYSGVSDIKISGYGTINVNGQTTHVPQTPLRFVHGKNITVEGITVTEWFRYHAVELMGVKDVIFKNVKFKGMVDDTDYDESAIQIEPTSGASGQNIGQPYDDTPCENITIDGCYFGSSDNTPSLKCKTGIESQAQGGSSNTYWHKNIKIINCIFDDITTKAICPYRWKNAYIANNKCFKAGKGFIYPLSTNTSLSLVDSTISENSVSNIGSDNDTNAFAIWLYGSDVVQIVNNMIDNVSSSVFRLTNSQHINIQGNICTSISYYNAVHNSSSTNLMDFNGSSYLTITGNHFSVRNDDTSSNSISNNPITYTYRTVLFNGNNIIMSKSYTPYNNVLTNGGRKLIYSSNYGDVPANAISFDNVSGANTIDITLQMSNGRQAVMTLNISNMGITGGYSYTDGTNTGTGSLTSATTLSWSGTYKPVRVFANYGTNYYSATTRQ